MRPIPMMLVSADSGTFAIERGDDNLELWDVASSRLRAPIRARMSPYGPACRPIGSLALMAPAFAALLPEGTIVLWDAIKGKERFRDEQVMALGPPHVFYRLNWSNLGDSAGRPVTFSADSKTLGVACRDGAVHLWDIPSAELRTVLPPPVPPLESSGVIVFSGDSRYLALAGEGTPCAGPIGCQRRCATCSTGSEVRTIPRRSAD